MLLIHEWFFSLLLGADNGHYIGDGGWGEGGGCSMFEENPVLNDLNEHDF